MLSSGAWVGFSVPGVGGTVASCSGAEEGGSMGERGNGTGLARAAGGAVGIATGIGARGSRVGLSAVPIVGETVVGRSGAEGGGAMGSGGSGVGEGLAATGSGDGRGRVRTGGSVSVMAVGDGVGLLPAVGGVVGAFVCGGCGEVVGR